MAITEKQNKDVAAFLAKAYPDAHCALNFGDDYECLVAVVLSAQTTDAAVNRALPGLFHAYPDPASLASASAQDVEGFIRHLGLSSNKAKRLVSMAQTIEKDFHGLVPTDKESLMLLPGVGEKTAGVVLAERHRVPALPVDTHVGRIAYRLRYCSNRDHPASIEKILESQFPQDQWIVLHHRLISFGRDICLSRKPHCEKCPLQAYCRYFAKTCK